MIAKTCIFLVIGVSFISCANRETTCTIKGKVINRKSDTLVLQKATGDIRFAPIKIPIKDNSFEYKLVISKIEAYNLVFQDEIKQGAWRPILLFPVNGEINCILYSSSEFEKNQINGSKLNTDFDSFKRSLEENFMAKYKPINDSTLSLIKSNKYYSAIMLKYQSEINNAKDAETRLKLNAKIDSLKLSGEDLSQEAKVINEQMDRLRIEMENYKYDYIAHNPTLLSYYFLIEDLQGIKYNKVNINNIRKNKELLLNKFPDHPYNEILQTLLDSQDIIKVGGSFIDFIAPDQNGKIFRLADIIKNKYAIIDLWSSWCGPCIKTSRLLIPIYETFKDSGFTVCGVASEIKSKDQMVKTIEKEKYPWINLIDLDNKLKIWLKYGIPNSGGGTFFIDNKGKILAINPSAKEIKKILTEKIGK